MLPNPIDAWVRRLRDPNPTVRQEAIRQLELIGDTAALGPLASIFALDPDPETRKLAQWAGRSIYYVTEQRITGPLKDVEASEEDRKKAAEILAKAQAKKQNRR